MKLFKRKKKDKKILEVLEVGKQQFERLLQLGVTLPIALG